jgi:hypothetical protein
MKIADLVGTFGFEPADGHHHFQVTIPPINTGFEEVTVYECLRFVENNNGALPTGATERVSFQCSVWKALSEQVRATFNLRLREAKRKPGKWHEGPNFLSPHYGKELVLLGWALEDLPIDCADIVFKNWRGLAPEERWWLYSTANAPFSDNSKKGRGRGWRKALSVALSENPLNEFSSILDQDIRVNEPSSIAVNEISIPKKKISLKKKSSSQSNQISTSAEENGEPRLSPSAQQRLFEL